MPNPKRSSIKRKSTKRRSVKRRSVKRRSVKRRSVKRKSVKRRSVKRSTKKRSSNKRSSPKRKSSPLKTKYCSTALSAAGKCHVLKAVIINYTFLTNSKRIVSKVFYFKTSKERNAYIKYLKDKYPTIYRIYKYDTLPIAIRK
jgi:hypothetical protein